MVLEKQRYGGWRKRCLMVGESGQRESDGISIFANGLFYFFYEFANLLRRFFAARNTAVRGAEVHILPLNFPLKKSSIWTAGTWAFVTNISTWVFRLGAELFN